MEDPKSAPPIKPERSLGLQGVKKPSTEQASQSSVVRRRRNKVKIRHF